MPCANDYLDYYRDWTDDKLLEVRKGLEGQTFQPVAKARVEAINLILEERLIEEAPAIEENELPFDVVVAKKYLGKRANARDRGIEFTLTFADMKRLLQRKRCYYTGVELLDDVDDNHRQKRTIERLDASKGYTKENCVAACMAANSLKALVFEGANTRLRMTKAEFKSFANKVA